MLTFQSVIWKLLREKLRDGRTGLEQLYYKQIQNLIKHSGTKSSLYVGGTLCKRKYINESAITFIVLRIPMKIWFHCAKQTVLDSHTILLLWPLVFFPKQFLFLQNQVSSGRRPWTGQGKFPLLPLHSPHFPTTTEQGEGGHLCSCRTLRFRWAASTFSLK